MKTLGISGAVWLMLVSVSACSSPPVLPDRSAPAVKAQEARLAKVIGADPLMVGGPAACKVRLLGQQGGAFFVWADCTAVAPIQPGDLSHTSTSAPVRVDGSKVTMPADGGGYSESLRKIFPTDLANYVVDNPSSPELRP
jgi:hypothetical protein